MANSRETPADSKGFVQYLSTFTGDFTREFLNGGFYIATAPLRIPTVYRDMMKERSIFSEEHKDKIQSSFGAHLGVGFGIWGVGLTELLLWTKYLSIPNREGYDLPVLTVLGIAALTNAVSIIYEVRRDSHQHLEEKL